MSDQNQNTGIEQTEVRKLIGRINKRSAEKAATRERQGTDQGRDINDPTDKGQKSTGHHSNTQVPPVELFSDARGNANRQTQPGKNEMGNVKGQKPTDASRAMPSHNEARDGYKTDGDQPSAFKVAAEAHRERTSSILSRLNKSAKGEREDDAEETKSAGGRLKSLQEKIAAGHAKKKKKTAPTSSKSTENPGDYSKKSNEEQSNDKLAEDLQHEFGPHWQFKLAKHIVETDKGMSFAREVLEEDMGREALETLLDEEKTKVAAYQNQGYAEQEGRQYAEQVWQNLSPEQKKIASDGHRLHQAALNELEYDFEKQAYAAGVDDAMAQQAMLPPGAGMPEDEAAMMPPGAEEEMTPEDLQLILEILVQQGEITPEEAEMLLQEVMAEQQGDLTAMASAKVKKASEMAQELIASE